MRKLSVYLKKYRMESILAPGFKLLEALMDLFVPLIIAEIINQGVLKQDSAVIIRCFILLLVLMIAGMLFSFTAQWFAAKASVGFSCDLRQDLFDHIQEFSYSKLDQISTDTLITRLTSDINQIQTGLNLALRLLLRSPFIVFGAMIMAFTIDGSSALIFLVVIPILALIVFYIMLRSIPLYQESQTKLDDLNEDVRENLSGVRVIRAFRMQKKEVRDFESENEALKNLNEKVGKLSAAMNPLTYLLINLATILLLHKGALQVNSGILEQGDVVALYNYMAQIIVELIKLASLTITINRSLACADRVAGIMDLREEMVYPEKTKEEVETDTAVTFEDVCFRYPDSKEDTLTDISFSVGKGQSVGIIGSTGSGKTTIVSLLSRFYDADKGRVLVNGIDVRDYSRKDLSAIIGIVPQKAVLFEGSIRENLKWSKEDADDEELWQALEIAQAKEVVEAKEGQLEYIVEQGGRNFSGGQRQRLTIARALVKKPEILILDDSASALDFLTDLKLRKAIRNKLQETTVFIVSQRVSSIRHCDLILVMEDGKLEAKGNHEQLLRQSKVYQEICQSQLSEDGKEDSK